MIEIYVDIIWYIYNIYYQYIYIYNYICQSYRSNHFETTKVSKVKYLAAAPSRFRTEGRTSWITQHDAVMCERCRNGAEMVQKWDEMGWNGRNFLTTLLKLGIKLVHLHFRINHYDLKHVEVQKHLAFCYPVHISSQMSQKDTKTYKGHVGYPVVSTQRVSILNKAECRRIAKWIDFRKAKWLLCVYGVWISYIWSGTIYH